MNQAITPIILPSDQVCLKDYLTHPDRKEIISINCIEKKAGLAQGTLSKFVNGKKSLNQKHIKKLLPVLTLIGYTYKRANWPM